MNNNNTTVEYAIEENKVLTVTSHAYLGSERRMVDSIIERYLQEVGLDHTLNNISFCIHEAACNAYKANLKRLYFDIQNIDIFDPKDYTRGMVSFKKEVLHRPHIFSKKHKERGYYVKLQFHIDETNLKVVIRNNVNLTSQEKERIQDKIQLAQTATNMVEVYNDAEDFSEGAGLGIVMLHIILRNMGFKGDPVTIHSNSKETICCINLNTRDFESLQSPS